MATQAQIEANRLNAQKSTGPRTDEGKRIVSQNAITHGLFAKKAVVRDENQQEYDAHREAFMAELLPVGPMESLVMVGSDMVASSYTAPHRIPNGLPGRQSPSAVPI